MNINELFERATPQPWVPGNREPDPEKRKANEMLFIHCVKHFRPALDALEKCRAQLGDLVRKGTHSRDDGEAHEEANTVLTAAQTIPDVAEQKGAASTTHLWRTPPGSKLSTLAALRAEAERQPDAMDKPRLFLALFPSGAVNGRFLDPYMGIIKINGFDGVFYARDLDLHNTQAIWADAACEAVEAVETAGREEGA